MSIINCNINSILEITSSISSLKEGDYGTGPLGDRAICLQIHGDAAVSGITFKNFIIHCMDLLLFVLQFKS